MRKFFAAALGSAVALVGFAGAAHASATITLLWGGADDETGGANVSETFTLHVILTAGPQGVSSVSTTTNFFEAFATGTVSVDSFACVPGVLACIFPGFDAGDGQIQSLSLGATTGGMAAGSSDVIGTITFHQTFQTPGEFEFRPLLIAGQDNVFNLARETIASTTLFESAFLVNVPEPGALAMLAMGLGGMLLAGRGRRS